MPDALPSSPFTTACFQIDSFSQPEWRALWSCLFDVVFVFHPGVKNFYQSHGHGAVFLLPHAVDGQRYGGIDDSARRFDLGWVGSLTGPLYASRRRLLPRLASRYTINDWKASVPEEKVSAIYRGSRIVVNIARDDYPQDANLRCFEAMAAGALLITRVPSELENLGLQPGRHFIGYRTDADLFSAIDHYLGDSEARERVARSGRAKILAEHTYDVRSDYLLNCLRSSRSRISAPARRWPASQSAAVYAHYSCKRVQLSTALRHFRAAIHGDPARAPWLTPHLFRCAYHAFERSLRPRLLAK